MTTPPTDGGPSILTRVTGLRTFYPAANPIGLMLDRITAALEAGVPNPSVTTDAEALLATLDKNSSAARHMGQALTALAALPAKTD